MDLSNRADELLLADLLELCNRMHADATQPLSGGWPNSRQDADRHRPQQVLLLTRRDDDEAVRLAQFTRDLRDKL